MWVCVEDILERHTRVFRSPIAPKTRSSGVLPGPSLARQIPLSLGARGRRRAGVERTLA